MKSYFQTIKETAIEELASLWVTSWQETMSDIDFKARRPAFMELMRSHRQNGYRIEGLYQDGLKGFIAVHPETGDLDQICVGIQAKGTSAAVDLLNHAKAISPKMLTLKVNKANPRAIRFYEREGFERVGEGVNPTSSLPIIFFRWRP